MGKMTEPVVERSRCTLYRCCRGKRWKTALRGLQSEFHSMQRKMRFKIFRSNKVLSSACTGQISQTHRCWEKSEEGAGSVPRWGLQCHRDSLCLPGPQSRWEPWPCVSLSPWFSVSWVIWKHLFYYYYFFEVDHLKSLYWICCNSASILWFGFVGCEAWGILALQLGIKPTPPALEGEVLTTGPPGKSLIDLIFKSSLSWLQNWGGKYRDFPYAFCLYRCTTFPTISIPTRVRHLWTNSDLVPQNPQFTPGSTLGGSVSLDKCTVACIRYYIII